MHRSPPHDFVIRVLTAVDLPQLRRLNVLFGVAFNDSATYCAQPPGDDYVRALLERLGAIAAQRGISTVFVQADYVDESAIGLYEKFGVREEVLHFDIRPPRDP